MKRLMYFVIFCLVLLSYNGCISHQDLEPKKIANKPLEFSIQIKEVRNIKPVIIKCLDKIAVENDGQVIITERKNKLSAYYPETYEEIDLDIIADYFILSGDGKTMVFNKGSQLFVTQLKSRKIEIIGEGINPSLSYDGQRIIFQRGNNIMLYDKIKSNKFKIIGIGKYPVISNNGKRVVYESKKPFDQLLLVSLDDLKDKITIDESYWPGFGMNFSGDDNLLLYRTGNCGDGGVTLYNLITKEKKLLPMIFVSTGWARLSKDGGKVLWTDFKQDNFIKIDNLTTNIETRFAVPDGSDVGTAFICSNGEKVIFLSRYYPYEDNTSSLWVVYEQKKTKQGGTQPCLLPLS